MKIIRSLSNSRLIIILPGCLKGNKIMTGMDETHFAPEAFLNRGQIATILYRMEGYWLYGL